MSDTSTTTPPTATSTTPTSTGSATTPPPPTSDTSTTPSSTTTPPSSTDPTATPTSSPPSSSDTTSQTTSNGNGTSSTSTTPTNTSTTPTSTSKTPTSSHETTISTPVTTVIQTTVITTNDQGASVTTIYQTSATLPAGTVITAPADANSGASSSSSNTGAIVGGVVGGIAGVAILAFILVWGYKRWRRRRDLEAFDGNFDPDRVVASDPSTRPASAAFGNSRHRNNDDSVAPTLPDMAQYDDGMGGRLAGAAVGGGVVSPYPLFGPGPASSYHGHSDSTHSPPNSAAFPGAEWRHPSPGPSLGAATTSSSGLGGAAAGVGMSPARMAKEREAFGGGFAGAAGMPMPHHPNQPNPYAYGPSSTSGSPPPSAYYNQGPSSQGHGQQGRRMSLESSAANSGVFYSTNSEYSQPGSSQYAGPGGGRLAVTNPDEEARQAYLAQGPSGVRVARDAGAVGDEEIPPTYESLVGAGGKKVKPPPEKGGLTVRNDSDDPEDQGAGAGGSGSGSGPAA